MTCRVEHLDEHLLAVKQPLLAMAVLYCLSGEDARRARKRTGVGRDGEGRVRSRVGKEGACGEGEVKAGPVREATHWIVGLARRGDRCGTGQPGCRRRQTRETASRRRTSTNWLLVNCVVSAVLPTPPSPSIVRRCSTGGRRAQEDDKSQRERARVSRGWSRRRAEQESWTDCRRELLGHGCSSRDRTGEAEEPRRVSEGGGAEGRASCGGSGGEGSACVWRAVGYPDAGSTDAAVRGGLDE